MTWRAISGRSYLEVARNPEMMREQMRATDQTMRNIEAHPEGFNALARMYTDVQAGGLSIMSTRPTVHGGHIEISGPPFARARLNAHTMAPGPVGHHESNPHLCSSIHPEGSRARTSVRVLILNKYPCQLNRRTESARL